MVTKNLKCTLHFLRQFALYTETLLPLSLYTWSALHNSAHLLIPPAAQETAKLVQELQTIAHQAGHPVPLLIALDQENGGVNSLYDEDYICQFPSAMGVAATGSPDMAYEVANATAKEVSAVGVNMIMGPVLDVLTNARYQPLGVRATGDDPQEVSQYGIAAMNGYKDAGITTCGKHFPSYGNLDFLGSSLDMPIITETLEQLSLSALVPFRNAIREGLDAIMVGGCAIANAGNFYFAKTRPITNNHRNECNARLFE